MTNEIAKTQPPMDAAIMESVLLSGDLSKLTPAQRVMYYKNVCESIGLNPLTRPFDYITLNGKLILYAKKDATDQLRNIKNVSIDDVNIVETDDQYLVKVKGHDSTGRIDVEIGVVKKTDMQGNLANSQMKAVTKAKRRLTLSLCGLGWLDETEVETIRDARPVAIDANTGEIVDAQSRAGEENQDTGGYAEAIELTDPFSPNAVAWAATQWGITKEKAREQITASDKFFKSMPKAEFKKIVLGG